MINWIKNLWKEFNRPMTKQEADNAHEWDMAQCGVKPCPCCGKRHGAQSSGKSTGPK